MDTPGSPGKTRRVLAALHLTLLGMLIGSAAALTPAGSLIEAQASARYTDSADVTREALSNAVVTVVQQVVAVTLTGEASRTDVVLPGGSADFSFLVTNAGNEEDAFRFAATKTGDAAASLSLEVREDANCNGRMDTGERQLATTAADDTQDNVSDLPLARGEAACVIVHALADTSAATEEEATVTLSVTSVDAEDNAAEVYDDQDTATASAVLAIQDAPVLAMSLVADRGPKVAPNTTVNYTFTVTNVGSSAACGVEGLTGGTGDSSILFEFALPTDGAGEPLAASEPTITVPLLSSDAVYAAEAINPSGSDWSTTAGASDHHLGVILSGDSDCFLAPGATAEATWAVTVPSTDLDAGALLTMTTKATYANTSGGAAVGVYGNASTLLVEPRYGVSMTNASGDTTSSQTDLRVGATVTLNLTVSNAGNAPDLVDITTSVSGGSAPEAWVCQTYRADGATPLVGKLGPIEAGGSEDVEAHCYLPIGAAATTADTSIVVTARSDANPDESATFTHTVEALTAVSVEVGGPDDELSYAPGATVSLFATVTSRHSANSFDLSAENWSDWESGVTFYAAAGTTMNACASASPRAQPITNTGLLAEDETVCIEIEVVLPADAASDWEGEFDFTATSPLSSNTSDSFTFTVGANAVNAFTFTPVRSTTVSTPGIATVEHTLTNTGNSTLAVTASEVDVGPQGTLAFATSSDGPWTATLTFASLAAGAEQTVYVRMIVPSGRPAGEIITAPIVVTAEPTPEEGADPSSVTLTDTFMIVDGLLDLALTVQACGVRPYNQGYNNSDCSTPTDGAQPGERLVYTLTVTNVGTDNVEFPAIVMPIPAYTFFVGVEASIGEFDEIFDFSGDGGDTWFQMSLNYNRYNYPDDQALVRSVSVRPTIEGFARDDPDFPIPTNDDGDYVLAPGQSVTVNLEVNVK